MDLVLSPCHLPGHWVLCHVLFKEGKVLLFDSLNERDGTSHRLKDVRAILYLLPSLLKHAGYYEEMKMDPHASPFTVQSMRSELIPQQDNGYSCGVFLMKYAELILAGVKTPWNSVFGQKDIKGIRKAIAIDIYTNGQPLQFPVENSDLGLCFLPGHVYSFLINIYVGNIWYSTFRLGMFMRSSCSTINTLFLLHIFLTKFIQLKMEANGSSNRLNVIFECWHERIAKAEETVINERENAKRLSVDYSVLMGKYQNLEAEIINLYVQIESRDNELNGPYQLVEQMQKKLMDFNIPPST
ncbi:hypothetical protein Dsin_011421 [Dipteronia sinensis]|uniref:Ubiquitin-like protease family profile domain-containing protein n=1 Tax=Dipteronia sinensis TaxID=43782 RepID=A0AAE0AU74_9ROSI|nr:hypothetical protein Dsin_011421 [Dipteronia sinensis]